MALSIYCIYLIKFDLLSLYKSIDTFQKSTFLTEYEDWGPEDERNMLLRNIGIKPKEATT